MLTLLLLATLIGSCYGGCSNVQTTELEQKDIDYLLKEHNRVRAKVAGGELKPQPGGIIPELTWDPELAEQASVVTNECIIEHNIVQKPGECIGQNIYFSQEVDPIKIKASNAVEKWSTEQLNFRFNDLNYGDNVLHYTQLVWANTRRVGCSYVAYIDAEDKDFTDQILCCNYDPCGNVLEEKPYNTTVSSAKAPTAASVKASPKVSAAKKPSKSNTEDDNENNEPKPKKIALLKEKAITPITAKVSDSNDADAETETNKPKSKKRAPMNVKSVATDTPKLPATTSGKIPSKLYATSKLSNPNDDENENNEPKSKTRAPVNTKSIAPATTLLKTPAKLKTVSKLSNPNDNENEINEPKSKTRAPIKTEAIAPVTASVKTPAKLYVTNQLSNPNDDDDDETESNVPNSRNRVPVNTKAIASTIPKLSAKDSVKAPAKFNAASKIPNPNNVPAIGTNPNFKNPNNYNSDDTEDDDNTDNDNNDDNEDDNVNQQNNNLNGIQAPAEVNVYYDPPPRNLRRVFETNFRPAYSTYPYNGYRGRSYRGNYVNLVPYYYNKYYDLLYPRSSRQPYYYDSGSERPQPSYVDINNDNNPYRQEDAPLLASPGAFDPAIAGLFG